MMMRIMVVLPAPFRPSRPSARPLSTPRLMPLSTCFAPKLFVMFSAVSRIGPLLSPDGSRRPLLDLFVECIFDTLSIWNLLVAVKRFDENMESKLPFIIDKGNHQNNNKEEHYG